MPLVAPNSAEEKAVDACLAQWRQGDCAFDELWFIHAGDPAQALTASCASTTEPGVQAITYQVEGLVVLSQTCDIVRSCTQRPYVEVAPLVRVEPDLLAQIQRGHRPAYATLPAALPKGLAVHLDRVMTVEKTVVAGWERTPGCLLDADARAFAAALARKRVRFAFPDDFTALAEKLQRRLSDKHEKRTTEGSALQALREIRVQASPAWDAEAVTLSFWFIRHAADDDFEGHAWADLLEGWLKLVTKSGRFADIQGSVVTLEDLTGADYVGSDPLDLDHLSQRDRSG